MNAATPNVDAPLPTSTKALKKLAEANSWLEDQEITRARFTSLAWKLALVFCALALMGWGMALAQMLKPQPAPVRVIVDRTTGDSMVVGAADPNAPALASVDQHWVAEFVKACDSYHFALLKTNYDQCARMSAPDVFAKYSGEYQGDKAKQTVVGSSEDDTVSLVSIRMTADTEPGVRGVAIATYDKTVTNTRGLPPAVGRYVETIRFEYMPKAMKKPVDRLENPFGFVVLGRQTDQELVAPTSTTAPDKASNSGSKT